MRTVDRERQRHDARVRKKVGDERQDGPNTMFAGKQIRFADKIGLPQQELTAERSVLRQPRTVQKSRKLVATGLVLRRKWSGDRTITLSGLEAEAAQNPLAIKSTASK